MCRGILGRRSTPPNEGAVLSAGAGRLGLMDCCMNRMASCYEQACIVYIHTLSVPWRSAGHCLFKPCDVESLTMPLELPSV